MKIALVLLSFLGILCVNSQETQAQTRTVNLMIDHSVGDSNYAEFRKFEIWDGKMAYLDNLYYYIHDVQIITDQGDTFGNLGEHFLVDGLEMKYELGTFDVDSVVEVIFNWGVAADKNHADPSQYPSDHPLAPKNPTMHWGWTSGYRFLRADGKIDDDNDDVPNLSSQYHMVGDQFVTTIACPVVSMLNTNDELEVWITAHYERLYDEVNVVAQALVHGSAFPMPMIYSNISQAPVFDLFDGRMEEIADTTDTTVGVSITKDIGDFALWPNPARDEVNISFNSTSSATGTIEIHDALGKTVVTKSISTGSSTISLQGLERGAYFVRLISNDGSAEQVKQLLVR